jgi:hypothetical protein
MGKGMFIGVIGVVISVLAACIGSGDFESYAVFICIFGSLVALGGLVICVMAEFKLRSEMNKNIREKDVYLENAASAIATYIEDKVAGYVLWKNERYSDKERHDFHPIRIDRNGWDIDFTARRKYGPINDRTYHVFQIAIDLEEKGSRVISLCDSLSNDTGYPIEYIDDLIADLGEMIKTCKLPEKVEQ